jgi:putative acyl-CoA dehydrogenase
VDHNPVTSHQALVEAVVGYGSQSVVDELTGLGAEAGSAEPREHGVLANRTRPS